MENLREILAKNLRENRRKLSISQPKLAEMAGLSTHYIAMIELSRKFPTPEVIERLAAALGIAAHELFSVPLSPEGTLEKLHREILTDLRQMVGEAVEKAINEQYKSNKKNRIKTTK